MNTPNTNVDDGQLAESVTRTESEIDASIEAKIDAAVQAAVATGQVDPSKPVGVFVGVDGSIDVRNVSPDEEGTWSADESATEPGVPDPVEFPAMYVDGTRESLADTYYKDHLESHWGF